MTIHEPQKTVRVSRRAILQNGTLLLGSSLCPGDWAVGADLPDQNPRLRIGLVTDLHFADKPESGSRYYRETRKKLAVAKEQFSKSAPDFLVELGDFIDAADSVDEELRYLHTVNQDFAAISKDRHYVLGNHCVHTLTKKEFLDAVERPASWYSFDKAGFHFVILDSCFRNDGQPYGRKNFQWTDANIPVAELQWLKSDLEKARKPTIVFAHQRLDVENHYGVRNAPAVREALETSGNVLAVFQGHSHKNDHREISGIHYCTLVAMVEGTGLENNAFSLLEIMADGGLRVEGFVRQNDYSWNPR